MMKKIFTLALTVFLLMAFLITSAQPPLENYYIVTLKGSAVRNVLNNYPAFSYFDFTYVQLNNKSYSLVAYAKDNENNQLGNPITLSPMTTRPTKQFRNIEKGHLYLTLTTMQDKNVNGSEDYVLTPKRCIDRTGKPVDYVSYRFSNKVYIPTTGYFLAVVTEFDLNPSPPY
jgi:hypothetical protein